MMKPKRVRKSRSQTPSSLHRRLDALAQNLRWTWSSEAQQLFASLDPGRWDATNHNPRHLLVQLSADRLDELARDESWLRRLQGCERQLAAYLRGRSWFAHTSTARTRRLRVAYFCAEYALHESVPLYSGGLGVLAGDHLKSSSDLGIPLVAVGLLYRQGYYRQSVEPDGSTKVTYPPLDFGLLPICDTRKTVKVPMGRSAVNARIWRLEVGRVPLYLLDTDLPANRPRDRAITGRLYGGDSEMRIRQEVLLGVGGYLALQKLGLRPTVYHLNEGHAAFCSLFRLVQHLRRGTSYTTAVAAVRQSTVFTTHTPVAAGHDRFEPALVSRFVGPLTRSAGLDRRQLLGLGGERPEDRAAPFCMTVLALNLAQHCNGVARLHGDTSRRMWMDLYGVTAPEQVPIGHVTNGVHVQTWLAPEIEPLYQKYLRPQWDTMGPDHDIGARAGRIDPRAFWAARCLLRRRLVGFVRQRLVQQALRQGAGSEAIGAASAVLDENALTVGFARRFATYKRAPLLFHDPGRLEAIVGDRDRPVQFIFAGKAHPADREGQAYLQRVHRMTRRPGFRRHVALLENYDMWIGRMLTSGSDVWLNTPLRPNEASGTSGMKPPLHGGINCSILDGWWAEAYNGRNGFAIGSKQFKSRRRQDAYDADCLYDVLENRIVPSFYQRNRAGLPTRWVKLMTESMRTVGGRFNTHRMLGEYLRDHYRPAAGLAAG